MTTANKEVKLQVVEPENNVKENEKMEENKLTMRDVVSKATENKAELKSTVAKATEVEKETKSEVVESEVKSETQPDVKPEDEKKVDTETEVKSETKPEVVKNPKTETKTRNTRRTTKPKDEVKNEEVVELKYQRQTRLEKSRKDRTVKFLFKNKTKLRFDLAIQRNEVWTNDQKSMLIHSILYGYPVPPVMVQKEVGSDNIWFLDGKQRLTTIIGYLSDEWALSKKTPDVFGFKIANKKFSELSEDMRDIIYDESITLIEIENMTDDERDEMFVRWNSGTGLSKIELTRALHTELIEQINEISNFEFFANDIALTDTARNRFLDQEMILQIAMLLDDGKNNIKGFGAKEVKEYVLRLKSVGKVLSDDIMKQINEVSHYLDLAVHDFEPSDRKKALKKIHIPIVFYTAIRAMKEKIKFSDFGVFVKDFLVTNYSVDSDYGEACQKGSSKKEAVLTRLNEMDLSLGEFIETLEAKNKAK